MSRHQKDPEPGDKQRGFIKGLSHSVGVFIEAVIGGSSTLYFDERETGRSTDAISCPRESTPKSNFRPIRPPASGTANGTDPGPLHPTADSTDAVLDETRVR